MFLDRLCLIRMERCRSVLLLYVWHFDLQFFVPSSSFNLLIRFFSLFRFSKLRKYLVFFSPYSVNLASLRKTAPFVFCPGRRFRRVCVAYIFVRCTGLVFAMFRHVDIYTFFKILSYPLALGHQPKGLQQELLEVPLLLYPSGFLVAP